MSQNKKIAVILTVVIAISAAAVLYSLKMLVECINDIKYADDENAEVLRKHVENQILGREIKNLSFINADAYYNVAENANELYAYCENQYLEMSIDKKIIFYFCYDRSVSTPAYGESECAKSAVLAVKECVSDVIRVTPYITNTAFDGHQYVFYVSLGMGGGVIVRVAADSGKVSLLDGRNINIL